MPENCSIKTAAMYIPNPVLCALLALMAFALTGCMENQQSVAVTGSGDSQVAAVLTDPATEAVLPGTKAVEWQEATGIFDKVCVKTYPNMSAAKKAIAKMPFVQNPQTGTYYHRERDLSIKLFEGQPRVCSMVFGSQQDFLTVAPSMAAFVGNGALIGIRETPESVTTKGPNNSDFVMQPFGNDPKRNYYNAVLRPSTLN